MPHATPFPRESARFVLPGRAGAIELATTWPQAPRRAGVAIVCHPHPLYGGTMDNKVISTLAKATLDARLASAAHSAGILGLEAARAHHLLNLGRAELQAGDADSGRATLEQAIKLADGCGDARTAASARTHLAQFLRDTGDTTLALAMAEQAARWFDAAGGGDGAAEATHLLADLRRETAT